MVPKREKSIIINKLLKEEVERIKRQLEEQPLSVAFHEASEDRERLLAIKEWGSLDLEDWIEKS